MAICSALLAAAACSHDRTNPCDGEGNAFDPTIYGLEARQEFYEMGWVRAVTGGKCGPLVDKWEESRADATSEYVGKDEESNPRSLAGYQPWIGLTFEQAKKACEGKLYCKGDAKCEEKATPYKRLCKKSEFILACQGGWMQEPDPTGNENKPKKYPYDADYSGTYKGNFCNGTDMGKGGVMTTGEAVDCKNDLGVVFLSTDEKATKGIFDLSGNVAEWVIDDETGEGLAAGGSYLSGRDALTCGSFDKLDPKKGYEYVGFRCCGPSLASQ
jgi:formylglycine-generating enzyme required for sulfatase activity